MTAQGLQGIEFMAHTGRSLQLYFIDGKPDGMLTAEVFNWTGHVLVTPRTQVAKALTRSEAGHTGVYILLGETETGPCAYIGEADNMARRLTQHVAGKDWWTNAVLVTTAADMLNKAHVKYLESRLVETAYAVGRMPLENGNTPPRPSLTEADVANMEGFLDYLFMVLPALRIDMFVQYAKPRRPEAAEAAEGPGGSEAAPAPVFRLTQRRDEIVATARLENDEFVVEQGSQARNAWIGVDAAYKLLRSELEKTGVIAADGATSTFTRDYAFKSPSAAAAVILGRAANGTLEWKHAATGETYKDWEKAQLAQALDA